MWFWIAAALLIFAMTIALIAAVVLYRRPLVVLGAVSAIVVLFWLFVKTVDEIGFETFHRYAQWTPFFFFATMFWFGLRHYRKQ
jgi:hypothetical protein